MRMLTPSWGLVERSDTVLAGFALAKSLDPGAQILRAKPYRSGTKLKACLRLRCESSA
jgi:hypothetical protein